MILVLTRLVRQAHAFQDGLGEPGGLGMRGKFRVVSKSTQLRIRILPPTRTEYVTKLPAKPELGVDYVIYRLVSTPQQVTTLPVSVFEPYRTEFKGARPTKLIKYEQDKADFKVRYPHLGTGMFGAKRDVLYVMLEGQAVKIKELEAELADLKAAPLGPISRRRKK
jgi:hypothetical protein